jgi:hypothetical protein
VPHRRSPGGGLVLQGGEEFVTVDEFERVGTWMEVSNWEQYTAFLTQWASASAGFETVIRRVSSAARRDTLHG